MNERHSPGLNKRRLGRLLIRFREEAGLTLVQAAERLYTSRSAVNRLEAGGTKVNVHTLKCMLDLYEMAPTAGRGSLRWRFGPGVLLRKEGCR